MIHAHMNKAIRRQVLKIRPIPKCIKQNKKLGGGLMSRVNEHIKARPIISGMGVACMKAAVCDILVQTFVEKKHSYKDLDYSRIIFFSQWGCWWGGLLHYHLYVRLFPFLFAKYGTFIKTIGQTFVCLLVYSPSIYFPAFYMLKQQCYDGISMNSIKKGLSLYSENVGSDVKRLCSIWVPAHAITFTIIPLHLRIIWMSGVSFIWTMMLSAYNGPRINDNDQVPINISEELLQGQTQLQAGSLIEEESRWLYTMKENPKNKILQKYEKYSHSEVEFPLESMDWATCSAIG